MNVGDFYKKCSKNFNIFDKFFRKNKVDVKMIIYNDMPHGFLNYDVPGGMKEAVKCVEDT